MGLCFVYAVLGWATKRTSPTVVALSMTLQPPLNGLLSVLFMGRQSFSAGEMCGGFLVTAGLVIVAAFGDRADADASSEDDGEGHLALRPVRGDAGVA